MEENNTQEPSFEQMLLEAEEKQVQYVRPGQKMKGKIILISKGIAYVDIGMRTEAQLTLPEGDERVAGLKDGMEISVFVSQNKNPVSLSLDPILGFGDFSALLEANRDGKPIQGKVVRTNKGGFEVSIAGVRAFCPMSHLDWRTPQNPDEVVGEEFEFKIIELDEQSENVVVSRKALLEEERNRLRNEAKERVFPGAVLEGTVVELKPFGAFVDLGGVTGLLHISELAHHKVERVEDVLNMNDTTQVKVLDVTHDEKGRERISLSLRALLPDPWDQLGWQVGDTLEGEVVRKKSFGAFINLAQGVDGLLPVRFMKRDGKDVDPDSIELGSKIEVQVADINLRARKIALGLPGWDMELVSHLKAGDVLAAEVVKVINAGVLVQALEDPARGLIPKRFLSGSMKELINNYPVGKRLDVTLTEIDERGRYTFGLKGEASDVDGETLKNFMDKDDLGHNPFSEFFKKQ